MAKVTLGGTINIQGTKKISRTNLAQLREPAITTRLTVAALISEPHELPRSAFSPLYSIRVKGGCLYYPKVPACAGTSTLHFTL